MFFRIFLSLVILFIYQLALAGPIWPIKPVNPVQFTVTVNNNRATDDSCTAANVIHSLLVTAGGKEIRYINNELQPPCRDLSTTTTVSTGQHLSFVLVLKNGHTYMGGNEYCPEIIPKKSKLGMLVTVVNRTGVLITFGDRVCLLAY